MLSEDKKVRCPALPPQVLGVLPVQSDSVAVQPPRHVLRYDTGTTFALLSGAWTNFYGHWAGKETFRRCSPADSSMCPRYPWGAPGDHACSGCRAPTKLQHELEVPFICAVLTPGPDAPSASVMGSMGTCTCREELLQLCVPGAGEGQHETVAIKTIPVGKANDADDIQKEFHMLRTGTAPNSSAPWCAADVHKMVVWCMHAARS